MTHCPSGSASDLDDKEYNTLVGLGGMCFVELDSFKNTGHAGPWGPFCDVFTTPNVVAACLKDDFQTVCDAQYYQNKGGKNKGGKNKFWHRQYSNMDVLVSNASHTLLHNL